MSSLQFGRQGGEVDMAAERIVEGQLGRPIGCPAERESKADLIDGSWTFGQYTAHVIRNVCIVQCYKLGIG